MINPIILLGGGAVGVFEVGGGETTIEGIIVVGGFETVEFSFTIAELDFLYFGRIISLIHLQMFKTNLNQNKTSSILNHISY